MLLGAIGSRLIEERIWPRILALFRFRNLSYLAGQTDGSSNIVLNHQQLDDTKLPAGASAQCQTCYLTMAWRRVIGAGKLAATDTVILSSNSSMHTGYGPPSTGNVRLMPL